MTTDAVVRAGALFDGTGRPPLSNGVVHVSAGLLSYVGDEAGAPPVDPGTPVYDLGSRFLMPGLIDCHAHPVPWRGGLDWAAPGQATTDELRVLDAVDVLSTAVRSGVTTFRDCGAPRKTGFALKAAVRAGRIRGPRLVVAGPPICPTGGHGHDAGGEADGADGVRRLARQLFKDGADFLKLTATGGGTGGTLRHRATFTVEELRAAVTEAEQHDTYATAHCHATEGIIRCLDAGVPMLEHATFVGPDGLEHLDRDVLARIRDQDVTVVPTVAVHGRWLERVADRVSEMDDAERALWRRRAEGFERRLDIVAKLHEAGVRVLLGSDGGTGRTYPAPLDDLAHSLSLHVRAGIPARAALASATSAAADAIGLGDQVGRLTPGRQADLIAVDGDPLDDIEAMYRLDFVLARGEVLRAPAGSRARRTPIAARCAASASTER